MKKLAPICAVVIFVMTMSAGATTINYTVSGWGPNQYPASITPPTSAPWCVDGYPGDTLGMVTYTGTLDLTPGTYNLKINTLNWTIDYTYGGTATNPDDWSNVFHNITAIRSISFDGGPSGSLSQTALLENQWANDFLTIDEGATSSFTVGGFQVNVTPLGLDQFGGTNFDGSNPWVQSQTDIIARFDVVSEPATTTTIAALPVANSVGSDDYAAGFAPGSWQANATIAGQKSEYYISPQALFGRDVTIGEISSIGYFTKKNTTHTADAADWYINIYTMPDANLPVHGTWYGNRIGSEPYFSENLVDLCNTWNQWVTAAGQNNRLRFFDSTNNQYFGSYTDGFLSDLTGNTAYNNQKILSFSVQTGSAWANGFTGLVDGLSIELTSGDIGRVNFVATSFCPEPLVGDLDGDCRVNFIDFAMMAENWLKCDLVSQEAGLDNLQWSVQYMIDTSQTDFGQIQSPGPRDNRGLAISPDGRYLYAGYNNGPAVRRIDLTVSDYINAADAQITGVRGKSIDVDDAGRVYLAEGTSIKIYNADLSSNLFNLLGLTNSEGVAVTRKNGQLLLYNSDRTDGTLKKWLLIESGGSITSATLDTTFGSGGSVALAGNLRGVGVDSNGKIWVAGYGNNTVYRVSSDGLTVNSLTINSPIDIDFVAGTALVSRYTDRVISRFDMNTMLSAGADITVPWTALELDPDGQSAGGALSGIAVFGNGFFVANETGQTADEKSTYGRTDGNSGYIGDKFYTDLYNDDNDPILFAIPAQATITCSGPLAGDVNGDCMVNVVDLAKMAENWLTCNLQPQSSCP